MKIPNFIGNQRLIDENGLMTEGWKNTFEQLFKELQKNMSDESHIVPSQPSATITELNGTDRNGGFLYDEDNHKAMVNINGVFKEIVTA